MMTIVCLFVIQASGVTIVWGTIPMPVATIYIRSNKKNMGGGVPGGNFLFC